MSDQQTLVKEVEALYLADDFTQSDTNLFLGSLREILHKSDEKGHQLLKIRDIVSYSNAKIRDEWLSRVSEAEQDFYDLQTCVEAARCSKPPSNINYRICYSYGARVFESTREYRNLIAQNTAEETIEAHRINHKHHGLIWHTVVVKFHDKQIYIYDPEFKYDENKKAYYTLTEFPDTSTARHLIKELGKQGLSINTVRIFGAKKWKGLSSERDCCDFIKNDIISYLNPREEIKKSDISQFCDDMKWLKVYKR